MPSFGFIGPSYQARSLNSDSERSVNLFPELVESGENASHGSKWVLYRTPGKQLFCALNDGPIACVVSSNLQFSAFDVTPIYFVVSGSTLYSVAVHFDGTTFTGVPTTIGTVDQKGGLPDGALFPAQIIVLNPNLLFVVANGRAWVAAFGAPVTSSVLNLGGLGYAVGDTGTVVGSNGLDARYTVLSVGGSGEVVTYSLTGGSGYATGTNITTIPGGAQPGAGDGNFTIDITGVGAAAWVLVEQAIPDGTPLGSVFIQSATFMDNYIIVSFAGNEPDPLRRQFYISGLNDPSTWSPLDFGEKEGNSDPNVAVFAANEILCVFGLTTLELWLDNPNGPAFPFQRMQGGGLINTGLASPWTICTMQGQIYWLGNDMSGQLVMWELGNPPKRLSNHAVEYRWRNFDVTGSSMFGYQENGHYFIVVHFPIPNQTWCCDTSTIGPDGKPCWHERLAWDGFNYNADIGRYHAWSFPVAHIVGDYRNSNLYIQSVDINADNCSGIRWLRVSPHIFDEQRRFLSSRFRLYMQTGTVPASGSGSDPMVSLRLSNDGGYTWGPYLTISAGQIGEYKYIVEWLRMGISRNRVYEVSGNDPVAIALVDAFVEAIPTVTR